VEDGESFSGPQGTCTTCVCQGGAVSCTAQICPELSCGHYEDAGLRDEGDCCPICIPRPVAEPSYNPSPCETEGEYTDPSTPCMKCNCHNGITSCLDVSGACPVTDCLDDETLRTPPGECCAVCVLNPVTEIYHRQIPSCQVEGEYTDPSNACMKCSCHNGITSCLDVSRSCPQVLCPGDQLPFRPDGQCCRVCPPSPTRQPQCTPGALRPKGKCQLCMCIRGKEECIHDMRRCPNINKPPEKCIEGTHERRGKCTRCLCKNGRLLCREDRVCKLIRSQAHNAPAKVSSDGKPLASLAGAAKWNRLE
jgi:hypothetical protein